MLDVIWFWWISFVIMYLLFMWSGTSAAVTIMELIGMVLVQPVIFRYDWFSIVCNDFFKYFYAFSMIYAFCSSIPRIMDLCIVIVFFGLNLLFVLQMYLIIFNLFLALLFNYSICFLNFRFRSIYVPKYLKLVALCIQ